MPTTAPSLRTQLKLWQARGKEKLKVLAQSSFRGGFLCDAVELGKSLTALTAALEIRQGMLDYYEVAQAFGVEEAEREFLAPPKRLHSPACGRRCPTAWRPPRTIQATRLPDGDDYHVLARLAGLALP